MKFLLVLTTVSLLNVCIAAEQPPRVGQHDDTASEQTVDCCVKCNARETNRQVCSDLPETASNVTTPTNDGATASKK